MSGAFAEEAAAVRLICDRLGLGPVSPSLLKVAHHVSMLVRPLRLVARILSGEAMGVARARAARELAVARHLAARGAPVPAPLAEPLAGPHVVDNVCISLWPLVPHARPATEEDASTAAASLAAVHRAFPDYAGALPPYTEALDRCAALFADDRRMPDLSAADRDLLRAELGRLRQAVAASDRAWAPLHGDAHVGNLLLGRDGPRWLDFEDACRGPREWDIACLPPAAWPRFDDADLDLVALCHDLKSVCVAAWCWADPTRSADMREAADYHLDRVRAFATRAPRC